jgi:N-acetylglucosamine-6-sulfatase
MRGITWWPILAMALGAGPVLGAEPARRPNVVVVLVDDLRWDEIDYPFVKGPGVQRMGREGARFANAFTTSPLCSPSRASLLTGRYAHAHGITDNTDRSPRSHQLVTFPRLLHDAGYETAFVGKWHMGVDDTPRPGFDRWVSVRGQGRYVDPELNVDGERVARKGYFTDVLHEYALEFLRRERSRPFLLYVSHKAVHPDVTQNADGSVDLSDAERFVPSERHRGLYTKAIVPHRPNHGRVPAGKPALLRAVAGLPFLGPDTATSDETIRERLRVLAAVDEGLVQILELLDARGVLDDTVVVFTSDEGYFYGEHGLSVERRLAYEESARVPLFVRYPRLVGRGRVIEPLVLGIDLAPTLLELAGAPAPADLHGRSLVALLRGETVPWREDFLIEHFSDKVFPRLVGMGYRAVRTRSWKYIQYSDQQGMDELYDLDADPYEMANRIDDPRARGALADMKARLGRLLAETP